MSNIMTIEQLAARLQVSERKIYELTRERNRRNQRHPLPLIRLGRSVRFKSEDVDAWLDKLAKIHSGEVR